jgi:hypothetical protein
VPGRWDDPAVQAYLAAFEAWLRAGRPAGGFTADLRREMLWEMVAGGVTRARILTQIAATDGRSVRRDG